MDRTPAACRTIATLALAATTAVVATFVPTAATAAPDASPFSAPERAALLDLLDAPTGQALDRAAASPALPDAVVGTVRTVARAVPGDADLDGEALVGGSIHQQEIVEQALRRVIDPTQYQCQESELSSWATAQLLGPLADFDAATATPEEIQAWSEQFAAVFGLSLLGALNAPTYDLLLHADDTRFQRFGANGINQTADLKRTFKDLQRFWDAETGPITFKPLTSMIMFSRTASDDLRYAQAALHSVTNELPGAETEQQRQLLTAIAEQFHQWTDTVPWIDADNPAITLNAFAFDPTGEAPVLAQQGKLLAYGDGLLAAQAHLGLLDVGPDAVMGHEYGHHVQYVLKAFGTAASPEATRRTELMADAYGAYFTSHASGMDLSTARQREVTESFAQVGDCGFDSDGHHGTPLQRQRAAVWGAGLADQEACVAPRGQSSETKKDGSCRFGQQVSTSRGLLDRFETVLPTFVAPDA